MNYEQGHVVNVRVPNQENPKESTYHPAIVVEDLEDEVFLVFMTSQLHQQSKYPDSFIITCASPEGIQMGLSYDSLICPSRSFQLSKIRIYPPPRGRCPESLIDDILDLM